MLKKVLNICLCFCFFSCVAQDLHYNVQYFDINDGLAGREVFYVQQDNRGLIWVGTDNGLNSFDGQRFNFVKDSTNLLSSGKIKGIKKDKDGNFWILKKNTPPILFNPETRVIKSNFGNDEMLEGLEMVISDGNGQLVNFTDKQDQTYYLDNNQEILRYRHSKKSLIEQEPTARNTLLVSHPDSNKIEELDRHGNLLRILNKRKTNYYYDSIGNFLIIDLIDLKSTDRLQDHLFTLEEGGSSSPIILKKNNKTLTYGDLNYTNEIVNYIRLTKDSHGNFWLVINEHLWLFDKQGNFKEDFTDKLAMLSGNIKWNSSHLFMDKEDRLWISTEIGLFLVQLKVSQFEYYLVDKRKYSTRGITELSNNRLLILTYEGAHILDRNTAKILFKNKMFGLGLSEVSKDTIYCGTEGPGVIEVKDSVLVWHNEAYNPDYKNLFIKLPFWDKKSNQLFLGTSRGLFVFVNDSIQRYTKLNGFNELEQLPINSFYQNEEGIWIGTVNGIYLLDSDKGVLDHFELPHDFVKYIHEDKVGDFWIGTAGGGLIHWERTKNKFRQITTKNGLSNDVIYAVYEDEAGYLWLPSNNGLMRFNKKDDEVVTFNTSEGLPHQEFNSYSHYQAEDGKLYFGGINGVIAFYPSQLNFKENNAPFIITELQQYDARAGRLVDVTNDFLLDQRIELDPGDRFFILNFSLLDYISEPRSYAWKIDGLDTDWNYQRENTLRINSLPHGNYTLQVKAKGRGGNWATNQLSIPIIVRQYFFQSPLFLIICGSILISLVYFGYKIRLNNLKKRQVLLENQIAERTTEINDQNILLKKLNSDKDQFFSIIGHDLRGPLLSLRGISKKISFLIQQNRMQEVHQLGESIEQSTNQVTKLLDNLLNWALVQKGGFPHHPELHNIQPIVQEMCDIYQSNADLKNISLLNLTKTNHRIFVDRNALSTIIRNLIDNAIKFTAKGGEIRIESVVEEEEIILKIRDTGIGIRPEIIDQIFDFSDHRKEVVKGTGLGLVLCKDLVEMNLGKITVESEMGKGTTFLIKLPRYQAAIQEGVVIP